MRTITVLCIAFAASFAAATQLVGPIKRARFPSPSPDGKIIAFCYQGDIWTVPTSGGKASRLTVHPAVDQLPQWSPDGKMIAFSSSRDGSLDVYVMSSDGGTPRKLTHPTSNEYVMGWTPDSKWVLFYGDRWGALDICKVPVSGGDAIRLTTDSQELEFFPAVSPDGRKIAYCYGGGPGQWRRSDQTGTGTADIWVGDFHTPVGNPKNLTRDDVPQLWPMWSPDGRSIYYVGGRETPNLWRMNADGGGHRKLTNFSSDRVRYAAISADGSLIAFEYQSEIWTFDTKTNQVKRVAIHVPGDQKFNSTMRMTLTSGASDFSVSPNGKRMLLSVRGDIFMTPESGGTTRRMTTFAGRDDEPLWKDDDEFFFVSLRNGNKDIFLSDLNGNVKPFVSGPLNEMAMEISPDRKMLAFHRNYDQICVVPVEGGEPKVVYTGSFSSSVFSVPSFSWSPDSKYLVLTDATERSGQNIEMVEVATGRSTRIGLIAKDSNTPKFTPDGKKVYLTSNDYDINEIFVIDLVTDPIVFNEDDLDKIDEKKEEKKEPVKVEVDTNRIFERMNRITRSTTDIVSVLGSSDSKNLYYTTQGQVHRIAITGGTGTAITTGAPKSGLEMGPDGKTVYTVEGGRIAAINLATGATSPRSFNADWVVDLQEESQALFEEVWWVMNAFFYDEKHHGKSWDRIRQEYGAMLPHAYDRAEFYDMMQEMVHELNASHLGVSGPTLQPRTGDDSTSVIGVEPDWKHLEATGEYRVLSVLEGMPASHPQSKLMEGDTILEVDGVKLNRTRTFDSLMNQKSSRKVKLSVRDANGATREVFIKPTSMSSERSAEYDNFVRTRRELTDKYSGGKLAYLHIRAMSTPSHEQFIREVRTLTQGKQGLIVDVRYNGGGNTAHLALGMLLKRPWLLRTPRGFRAPISENLYRGDSVELPSALLINALSFSNAEIMAEGYRALKVGPVVGVATSGGVIGTGSWTLFDGGSVRTPMIGAYTMNGENLEGIGRKPDYPVPYDPIAVRMGEDPMLKKAVELLLRGG